VLLSLFICPIMVYKVRILMSPKKTIRMISALIKNGKLVVSAKATNMFELCPDSITYYHSETDVVTFGAKSKLQIITVNDKKIRDYTYNVSNKR